MKREIELGFAYVKQIQRQLLKSVQYLQNFEIQIKEFIKNQIQLHFVV